MLELPFYIPALFIITTLMVYIGFVLTMVFDSSERVKRRSHIISLLLLLWLVFQSTLALNGWFMDRNTIPPHIAFPLITAGVITTLLFATSRGRRFIDGMSWKGLTWIHVVRIPVEITLYQLANNRQIPVSMTWNGFNFDIIFGITAIVVAYLYFQKHALSDRWMFVWNVLGLISLATIVIISAGAIPSPLQMWDFNRPNYAMLHFPFVWLPAFIVPVVLIAHLKGIRESWTRMRSVK